MDLKERLEYCKNQLSELDNKLLSVRQQIQQLAAEEQNILNEGNQVTGKVQILEELIKEENEDGTKD